MKKRKIGLIAAMTAVLLLITAVLVTTCTESVNTEVMEGFEYTPSPGKGYIAFRTADGRSADARTLVPTSLGFSALSDFDEIDILIVDANNPLNTFSEEGLDPSGDFDSGDIIEVPPGEYYVTILGYIDRGSPLNLVVVAAGSHSGTVEVEAGTGGTANVVLTEVVNPVLTHDTAIGDTTIYNGRFVYNLTIPAETSGTMSFTSLSGTTPPGDVTLTNSTATSAVSTGNVTIPAGYYRVLTTLESIGRQSTIFRETVHIWAGHDTAYTRSFPTLNNVTYTATLDADGGSISPTSLSVFHGETLDEAYDKTTATQGDTLPAPTRNNDIFEGWETAGGVAYDPATTRIIGDVTLIAQWLEVFTVSFNANGGSLGSVPSSMLVRNGETLDVAYNRINSATTGLPEPTRTGGWIFDGWETSGGTAYNPDSDPITSNLTLLAQWAPPSLDNLEIIVSVSVSTHPADPDITVTTITISRATSLIITIPVNNATNFTNYATNGIEWYLSEIDSSNNPILTLIDTGATLVFNLGADVMNNIIGTHEIVCEAIDAVTGIPVSRIVTITITP